MTLASLYSSVAKHLKVGLIILLNFVVLLIVLNLGVAFFLRPNARVLAENSEQERHQEADAAIERYGMAYFERLYPGMRDADIRQLILDQTSLSAIYEPFVEFRMPPHTAPTLNVHPAGFRLIGRDQGPWPLDPAALNIFVFGGSMALGASVPDGQAIPADLQLILRRRTGMNNVNVYNFATGSYFSSQEVTWFQNLLRAGNHPDMVVFVDGENDFYFANGETSASESFRKFFNGQQAQNQNGGPSKGMLQRLQKFVTGLPVAKLAEKIKETKTAREEPREALRSAPAGRVSSDELYQNEYHDDANITDRHVIDEVISRYFVNKQIAEGIAAHLGIESTFIWQPTPLYRYDLHYHPFHVQDEHRRSRYGYPVMADYLANHSVGSNFAWCADIFDNTRHPLYLDQMHYNAEGNRRVAGCIADAIMRSGAVDQAIERKFGKQVRVAADEADARSAEPSNLIASFFGEAAQNDGLTVSKPIGDWDPKARDPIRLADDSPTLASVLEDVPIDEDVKGRVDEVTIEFKPDTSNDMALALHYLGGPSPQSFVVFFNPQTEKVISTSGSSQASKTPDGWLRLTLAGAHNGTGNTFIRAQIFPEHGNPEDHGAIFFRHGELDIADRPFAQTQ